MKAAMLAEPGRLSLDDKPIPDRVPLDALLRTHCGNGRSIVGDEYPMRKRLTLAREPAAVTAKLGSEVKRRHEGRAAGAHRPGNAEKGSPFNV